MPNLFPQFSTEIITVNDAYNTLVEYAEECDIDLSRLPQENIENFIDTMRYAPYTISTEDIAERCGISEENYIFGRNSSLSDIFFSNNSRIMSASIQASSPTPSPIPVPQIDASNYFYDSINGTLEVRTPKRKPKRSVHDMMAQIVRGSEFPRPNFIDWSNERELSRIFDDWYRNVEHKEHWIFSRREREGFNRRNIGYFNLEDVQGRLSKRKRPHELDTETSKFYDWKFGGTDWILRLELHTVDEHIFLISRYIYRPSNAEIRFDVRYWNGEMFKMINGFWTDYKNNKDSFERVFGSLDEDSPYYIEPHGEDEFDLNGYYQNYRLEDDCGEVSCEDMGWDDI